MVVLQGVNSPSLRVWLAISWKALLYIFCWCRCSQIIVAVTPWWINPLSKWLITIVIVSPLGSGDSPSKWPSLHGLQMGVFSILTTETSPGMILQVDAVDFLSTPPKSGLWKAHWFFHVPRMFPVFFCWKGWRKNTKRLRMAMADARTTTQKNSGKRIYGEF